mgnify:CR=1 FL=1
MLAAFRALLRRPVRTALTVLGVAVGFAAWVGIRSSATGFVARFNSILAATGAEITVQQAGVGFPVLSRIAIEDLERVRAAAGARSVTGVVAQLARLPNNNQLPVFGVPLDDPVAALFRPVEGRPLGPGTALLGRGASASAGQGVGGTVEVLPGRSVPVAGVYESAYGFLDGGCVVTLDEAQRLFGMEGVVSLVLVKLPDPSATAAAIEHLNRELPHLHASVSELFFAGYREMELIDRFARFLALAALFVSALGVANTLGMNVVERVSELAILRAVGWSRWRIARAVLLEGALLAGAGALLGVAPAWAFVRATGVAGLQHLASPRPSPELLLGGAVIVLVAGLLGSLPAVAYALRSSPSAALRAP